MPRVENRSPKENETIEYERQLRIRASIAVRQLRYKSLRAFLIAKMEEAVEKAKGVTIGAK